ncbi:MAG TPA: LPS export ABC transporter periplasmic protein LptC [Bacteroidia bacterium]|nr:LPS export ABC transporter periplasmic protein LptC [Bacteroidia bacterium]
MSLSKTYLLFAFAGCFLLHACANDPAKVKAFTRDDRQPVQTAHDVDMLYTDSAKLKIHITSPQVKDFAGSKPYTEMPEGVKVEFFDDAQTVNSYLTSNYAIRKQREQQTEARNDVVVVNIKGEKLNTEKLIWDEAKHRIYTDAFVKITTKDQVLMGNGLDSDESFTNYEIKDITGSFTLKDPDKKQP